MPPTIACPFCGATLKAAHARPGDDLTCPSCRALFRLTGVVEPAADEPNPFAAPTATAEDLPIIGALAVPPSALGKCRAAARLYLDHIGVLAALVLTVWLPGKVLLNAFLYSRPDIDGMTAINAANIAESLLGPIEAGALIAALLAIAEGRRPDYRGCLGAGFANWGRVFVARLLAGLAFLLGLVLLIVPGLVLLVRYALVDVVAVAERTTGSDALGRSATLTAGRRWSIFGAGLLYFGFAVLVQGVLAALIALVPSLNNRWAATAADCLAEVVLAWFTVVLFLYYLEGRDAEDAPAPAAKAEAPVDDLDEIL